MAQSSPSSGIFFQGDGQSQMMITSLTSSSFGNSSNSVPGAGRSSLDPVSGDMNNAVLNSVANSGGHSVGASSLVTDANSSLSGRPHLQRSASINTESYMRLPASPMSFSSNNISISGSSVMDGSSVVQQSSPQDQNAQQMSHTQHSQQQHQQQPQGPSSVASLPMSQHGQVSLLMGARAPGCFIQDSYNISHLQKKPRLDMKQEDIMQQQVLQQLLQRQGVMQLSSHSQQVQGLIMQQRLRQQQQQLLQSMPQFQRAQLQRQQQEQQQEQQQLQLRQQLQQHSMQSLSANRRTCDVGVCARRLMQFLYHQRQRPPDSSISYWRKFVAEYYSPRAKKRWCFSLYENVGHLRISAFPQATMDSWQCDICGAKSGRGFEATYEILPRLNEIQFSSGVVDELLFLDLPREFRFSSGIMMLEYGKAVQESAYEQVRVVREGQLRIIFTQDLKILSWEFCARRHEELLARRLVAPQVNQLLQVAQKCQNTISESGPDGVSQQDLQTNSDMVLAAGRQLAKSLDLQSLNDLGFSKRYVRCFQIAEVVNSMKDLIGFSMDHKVGPIDALKNFAQQFNRPTLQRHRMQELEQLANIQGLSTDWNALNKLMSVHPGISNQVNSSHVLAGTEALGGPTQAAMALTNYQNLLMRHSSNSSNTTLNQQEASSSMSNHNQSPSTTSRVSAGLLPRSMSSLPVSGTPNPHLPLSQPKLPHQLQHHTLSNSTPLQIIPQSSPDDQALQQQMVQQMLQEMSNNSAGVQQQSFGGNNPHGIMRQKTVGSASNGSATAVASSNVSANSRSNSFKGASNSESTVGGNIGFNQKAADIPQTLLQDDILPNILDDFTDSGFLNSDFDDNMGYGWKA